MKGRKILIFALAAFVGAIYGLFGVAQAQEGIRPSLVNMSKQNRNVLIEEFTGVKCGYCPNGHLTANNIVANNPGRVFVLNIHTHTQAQSTPEYQTPHNAAIFEASYVPKQLPVAAINRYPNFTSTDAVTRSKWADQAKTILALPSYVNIGSKVYIDTNSREMLIAVELYYSDIPNKKSSFLNVALIQDSIIGSQSSGYTNPDQMLNSGDANTYIHQHMLRDLFTGTWGEQISDVQKGVFIRKFYKRTIPESIVGVNEAALECVLKNVNIIAFVCEDSKSNVMNVCKAERVFGSIPKINTNDLKVNLLELSTDKNTVVAMRLLDEPKTRYRFGEDFESDLRIELTYGDLSADTVNANDDIIEIKDFYTTSGGVRQVEIRCGEQSYKYQVSVVIPMNMSILSAPNKLKYKLNEELDLEGGLVKISCNDNKTDTIEMSNYTFEVSGFDSSTVGEQTITIKYANKKVEFNVSVSEEEEEEEEEEVNLSTLAKAEPIGCYVKDSKVFVHGAAGKLVYIYNLSGKLVFCGEVKSDLQEIEMKSKGVYILSCAGFSCTGGENSNIKFIIK